MNPQETNEQEQEQEGSMIQEIFKNIVQLNKERLECERNYQFVEAGRIKDNLKKLGEEYIRVNMEMMREKQRNERESLEAEYEKDVDASNTKWDAEIAKGDEDSENQYNEITQRQQQELTEVQEKLKKIEEKEIKMSPEILNLQHQIQGLVKDQRYNEAAILQKKLEKSRDICVQKNQFSMDESIRNKLETVHRKHENEIMAIEKRINANREAMYKAKELEFEQLNSRFKVYREKLENNHANELIKEEKRMKSFNPCSNNLAMEE